jgi:hypothetical protein
MRQNCGRLNLSAIKNIAKRAVEKYGLRPLPFKRFDITHKTHTDAIRFKLNAAKQPFSRGGFFLDRSEDVLVMNHRSV